MRRFLGLMLLLSACSSSPVPPVIDHVTVPPTASAGASITASIDFHDNDAQVTSVRVAFPMFSQSKLVTLPAAVDTGTTIDVGITFPTVTPPGPFAIDLSLVDAKGLESAVVEEMVTIQ